MTSKELDAPGFVVDFANLATLGDYLSVTFDHRDLNEVVDFEPTCERLAEHLLSWSREHLQPHIAGYVSRVRVSESPTSWGEVVVTEVEEYR